MADPYAFTDASGNVLGTYADPSAEFGAPGWSFMDPSGNPYATYADPSAELGWGSPRPAWGAYNMPRGYMYGMGAAPAEAWYTPTPKKVAVVAALALILFPKLRKKTAQALHLQNPPKRRRRGRGRRSRRSRRAA